MEILDFDEFSVRLEKLTVLGAKNPNADWNLRSNYSGKDFKCGCGKKHEFFWKDGPHLKKQSYSPIATYVLRELRGMRFVFSMTHCHYHNLVKINFLGNFKTLVTFRHGDPQASIRDYEERFFERAGVKNPMKKHYPKNKEIKEVNTKAKPPEFSSKTKKSTKKKPTKTKKVVKKKIVKKRVVKEKESFADRFERLFEGKYGKISNEQEKINTRFEPKLKKWIKVEKEYLSSQKKYLKSFYKNYAKDFGLPKKEVKEEIDFLIEDTEEQFKKTNKHYYDFIKFLKKLKSEI